MVGDDRFVARPFCSKGRLLKGPVLVKIKSCGESGPPLQKEETKYLAVSPERDNLSIKTWKLSRISSSQFLSKNLWLNKGEGSPISIGGSLGKILSKKNLVFSTNRQNLF